MCNGNWGCGCNRNRRTEAIRDTREFVTIRRSCKDHGCHDDHSRGMSHGMMNESERMEMRDNGRRRNTMMNNNTSVSPSSVSPTSSFCQRQLEAARNSCIVNPLTIFNRCNR